MVVFLLVLLSNRKKRKSTLEKTHPTCRNLDFEYSTVQVPTRYLEKKSHSLGFRLHVHKPGATGRTEQIRPRFWGKKWVSPCLLGIVNLHSLAVRPEPRVEAKKPNPSTQPDSIGCMMISWGRCCAVYMSKGRFLLQCSHPSPICTRLDSLTTRFPTVKHPYLMALPTSVCYPKNVSARILYGSLLKAVAQMHPRNSMIGRGMRGLTKEPPR